MAEDGKVIFVYCLFTFLLCIIKHQFSKRTKTTVSFIYSLTAELTSNNDGNLPELKPA